MTTTVTKDNIYPVGNYHFTTPKEEVKGRSDEDIMMDCGYHPAGYGTAYKHEEDDKFIRFQCSGSCD